MKKRGEFAYLADGRHILVPEHKITTVRRGEYLMPLRGHGFILAVFNADEHCIGWIDVTDLGIQAFTKAYVLAKLSEGAFKGLAPAEVLKKAVLEFASDVPAALGDLFGGTVAQLAATKAQEIASAIAQNGVVAVLGELKENLDMQYQRGVERSRRKAR